MSVRIARMSRFSSDEDRISTRFVRLIGRNDALECPKFQRSVGLTAVLRYERRDHNADVIIGGRSVPRWYRLVAGSRTCSQA